MIEYDFVKPRVKKEVIASLDPLVKEWFFSRFEDFSLTQLYGVLPIYERKNILISAPTGGTKTLTAFLSILNYLVSLAKREELEARVYAVYVSPLKALTNDIAVNLVRPLDEIKALAEKKGIKLQEIRVGLRTGDTETKERAKMARKPPQILVTTPESLAIMLNSPKFSEKFELVEFMIVDEIHSLAENKRGVHLSLTLERLQERSKIAIARVGLSATVAPLKVVANYLVGSGRDCLIAEVEMQKKLDLKVLSPVGDFLKTDSDELNEELYNLLNNLIEEHKTVLIFTNTRAATERVVHNLKEKFPKKYIENIGAHHSSLSKAHRYDVEERLRKGLLEVVVCSTSLELGIDIGYIDLVILLGSPKAVSRAMQRVGRAGHQLHETAKGRFVIYEVDDLVESSVIMKHAIERKIDEVHIPDNCLDVLSQHVYGMSIQRIWKAKEMYDTVKKSYCYRNLTKADFYSVISYLSGEYELEARNLYRKIWYNDETGEIGKSGKMARVIYMTNIGTIPDESFAGVYCDGIEVGKIDEEFLGRLRKGDVFVLGGSRYQYAYTRGMKVQVKSAGGRRPTIPSWFSEMMPLSFDSAWGIGKFRGLVNERFENKRSKEAIKKFIEEYVYTDDKNAGIMYNYFEKQFKHSLIPHNGRILIEEYREEKNYLIFHTMFGRRVNDALSRAVAYVLASSRKRDVEIGINDNGFFIASKELNLAKAEKIFKNLKAEELEEVLKEAIEKTEVLKRRFRHCASRGLMILRNYRGNVKSVGRQQMSSHFLLAAINKKTKDFPILKEARREVLEDLMDLANAKMILRKIEDNKILIEKKNTRVMSPFAINLILQSHADVIRVEDKIDFIKRIYAELDR
jgi:ATP-dependent helicase Lhr and Lhr-like helicase